MHTRLLLTAAMAIGAAYGAPILDIIPAGGMVQTTPAGTTGWGFTLTNTTDYAVVTQALLSDITTVDFVDFISAQLVVIGPDGAFAQSFWPEAYDPILETGIGAATLHPGFSPGDHIDETITLFYDLYSTSPLDPAFDPLNDGISFGNMLQASARIDVVAPAAAPEPGTMVGAGVTLLVAAIFGRRRREARTASLRARAF